VLYLGIAFAVAGLLWASSHFLVSALFRSSTLPVTELLALWKFLIFLVFANILTLLFSSIVIGLQRMDLSTGMNSLNLLLSAGLSVAFCGMDCNSSLRLCRVAPAAGGTAGGFFVSLESCQRNPQF
jgi:hypothetical protein